MENIEETNECRCLESHKMSKSIFKKRPAAVINYGLQVQLKFCRPPYIYPPPWQIAKHHLVTAARNSTNILHPNNKRAHYKNGANSSEDGHYSGNPSELARIDPTANPDRCKKETDTKHKDY